MGTALNNLFGKGKSTLTGDVEFWHGAERTGWLMKQGEYIKTWRRRWFVLKQGKIFWFKSDIVTPDSIPRGVIEVNRCLSIKGAEDILNKPHAFEVSTTDDSMFFIADTDKEKEDWINAVGRAIVRHSKRQYKEQAAQGQGNAAALRPRKAKGLFGSVNDILEEVDWENALMTLDIARSSIE